MVNEYAVKLIKRIKHVFLFILLLIAAFIDLKTGLIHNELIIVGLLVSVIFRLIEVKLQFTVKPLKQAFLGILTGTIPALILFILGYLGAGDVKLLAVIGLLLGVELTFMTSVIVLVITGGISAILYLNNYQIIVPFSPFLLISYVTLIAFKRYINKKNMESNKIFQSNSNT